MVCHRIQRQDHQGVYNMHYVHILYTVHPESFRSNTLNAIAFARRNRPRVNRSGEFACVYLRLRAFASTVKSAKSTLLNQDWKQTINAAKMHSSLRHIVCSDVVASSWCRLWDQALDLGIKGIRLTQCLFHFLCRSTFGDRLCPHCATEIPQNQTNLGGQLVMDFAKSVFEFHLSHSELNFHHCYSQP